MVTDPELSQLLAKVDSNSLLKLTQVLKSPASSPPVANKQVDPNSLTPSLDKYSNNKREIEEYYRNLGKLWSLGQWNPAKQRRLNPPTATASNIAKVLTTGSSGKYNLDRAPIANAAISSATSAVGVPGEQSDSSSSALKRRRIKSLDTGGADAEPTDLISDPDVKASGVMGLGFGGGGGGELNEKLNPKLIRKRILSISGLRELKLKRANPITPELVVNLGKLQWVEFT